MPLPIQNLSISPQVKSNSPVKELVKPASGKEAFSRHLQEAIPAAKDNHPTEPAVSKNAPEKTALDAQADDLPKDEQDGAEESIYAVVAPVSPQADVQGMQDEAAELIQNALGSAYDVQLQINGQQQTELDPLAGILEGSAEANQPAADARIDFKALMQSEGSVPGQITDDPIQDARAVDAMARMPMNAELTQQELEEWGVTIQPGSLENADEQIPPPSRVQIGQITGDAEAAHGNQANTITPRAVPMTEESSQPSFNAALAAQAEPVFTADSTQPEAPAPALPFEQIALETTLQQGLGKDQFVMRLKPESLGEVTVRLAMHSDGVVARITVSSEAARTALAEQLYQLGDSMRDKGVIVRSVELVQDYTGQSAMLHDGNQSPAGQGQAPRWKRARAQSPAETVAAIEGYDSALIAQITYVGEGSQIVTIDA